MLSFKANILGSLFIGRYAAYIKPEIVESKRCWFWVIQKSNDVDFNLYCVEQISGFIYLYSKILYIKKLLTSWNLTM